MRKPGSVLLCSIALTLTACATPSLDARLAGKSEPQQMKVLYYECLERAHHPIDGGHDAAYFGHERRQHKLCDQMYEAYKADAPSNRREGLAKDCSAELSAGLLPSDPKNVAQLTKRADVCSRMTGHPVALASKK